MIPFLLKSKLAETYGEQFLLPNHIDLLLPNKEAYQGDEHDLQKSFFQWLSTMHLNNPYLYLVHAIPNGGTRDKITAGRLKAEGVRAGIPDVFIPIPNNQYKGMYIEFKAKANKPSEDQRIVLLMLDTMGYKVICANTLDIAITEFIKYMK